MADDTDIIRQDTWSVETSSLELLNNEPVPSEIIRDLLLEQWHGDLVGRPHIHVLNDTTYPTRENLRQGDVLIIEVDVINETQRGYRYEFKDIEIPVSIQFHTVTDRQRLYNLLQEVRRIIQKNHMATRPYQMIYWDSFEEDSEGLNRYWRGYAHIRLTSEGVPIFKAVVAGMGSQNLPIDQR